MRINDKCKIINNKYRYVINDDVNMYVLSRLSAGGLQRSVCPLVGRGGPRPGQLLVARRVWTVGAGTPATTANTSPQTYPSQAGCQPCTADTAIMMVAALRNADAGLPIELSTNFHRRVVWLEKILKAVYQLCSLRKSVPISRLLNCISTPV